MITTDQDFDVRYMIRLDMDEVLRIEHTSYDYPWCEDEFLGCLRRHNCVGAVAEQGDKVVGFMVYALHKTKFHILNLAVHAEHRRCGVGSRMLLEKLISKLSSHRRTKIVIDVRETNMDGLQFLRSLGFRATALTREYYDDTGEDAVVMRYDLQRPGGSQE